MDQTAPVDAVSLLNAIDQSLAETLVNLLERPDEWWENNISARVIETLNQFSGAWLATSNGADQIFFDARKQSGQAEKERGDIALIVARGDGKKGFIGTAFIEAKRRNLDPPNTFDSFDGDQLRRILRHEPHSVIALYDYQKKHYTKRIIGTPRDHQVAVLPAASALYMKRRLNANLGFSTTFGFQFVARYLNGCDMRLSADFAGALAEARKAQYVARLLAGNLQHLLTLSNEALNRYDNLIELSRQIGYQQTL